MAKRLRGNLSGLSPSQIKGIERLFARKIEQSELVPLDLAREVYSLAEKIGRRIGLLVSREGRILEVVVGKREILYLPDLGRYRFGRGRLRRLRLIFSDLSRSAEEVVIPADIYADLEKLRLDAVIGVKQIENRTLAAFAHLIPVVSETMTPVETEQIGELAQFDLNYSDFIGELEQQLAQEQLQRLSSDKPGAMLVGVYPKGIKDHEASLHELRELARTAGVEVLGEVVQRRTPDPKTLLGKGKLEQVVLQCLRLGAEILIFDGELKPFQWRVITNSTELKVIDRSMLILDIFSQRASSAVGRLQVELAQLKYNLPRLVEKDAGLSRLTGGIGGRGPGETKLEIGRRRSRDRIRSLEQRIKKLSKQRGLQRSRRQSRQVPLVAILGYTNAGKSTLFNALTRSDATVEDKLFATLEPTQRTLFLSTPDSGVLHNGRAGMNVVLSDTVGFIRDLPDELTSAFRATLEELYEADLLIHVVDSSDPDIERKVQSVESILRDMDLAGVDSILVLNKSDRVAAADQELITREYQGLPVSASEQTGLGELLLMITSKITSSAIPPLHRSP